MFPLDQTKNKLRALMIEEPGQVYEAVKTQIPVASKKMKTLSLLQGRYQDLLNKVQKGVISSEDQSLETNRIREQLLLWIDGLEEKDLLPEEVRSKKAKPYLLRVLLAIVMMLALGWCAWYLRPAEIIDQKVPVNQDTVDISTLLPDELSTDSSEKTKEDTIQELGKQVIPEPIPKITKEAQTVEQKIIVPSLWKDSDIMVDGLPVEPLKRVGTYIFLALSPGPHKIRLISGGDHCEQPIQDQKEGGTIPFVCD